MRTRIVLLLGALTGLPAAVMLAAGTRMLMMSSELHFIAVAVAAGLTCAASVRLTLAGARVRDGRSVLLGIAFSTMSALFTVHGISTPGVLVGPNGMIALAGGLSIPVGAALLALTALPGLRRPRDLRPLLALQVVLAVAVLALGALGLALPALMPVVPQARTAPAFALCASALACLAVLVVRAVRTSLLTRRTGDLLVGLGCAWLALAAVGLLVCGPMTVGYYLGHVLELGAVALVAIPAALDIRRTGASLPLVGDLTASDLVAAEEAYLGSRVRALVVALAERDASTEQHTRRVALLAARVGEALRLPADAQRRLAVGGLLHDVGKLSVPLEVLRKPGPLDDAEFALIKRHPADGRRLLEELGGFPEGVRDLVSDHHERLDGSGYPRGLTGADLSVETRILAVVDVYDALVSDRVYRPAWDRARALALLHEESGTGFDPRVVAALEDVLGAGEEAPAWVAGLAGRAAGAAARAGGAPTPRSSRAG